jgi:hypothetical protein
MMGRDTVALLVRKCGTHGKRYKDWDFPDSLMSHAVARCFYTQGFKAVLALAESVAPGDVQDEVLYAVRQCQGWDDKAQNVLELLRFENQGAVGPSESLGQLTESAKTWDFAKLRELALALVEELSSQTGPEALEAVQLIQSRLEHMPRDGSPTAVWPDVIPSQDSIEQCFPVCLWDEQAAREETDGLVPVGECEKRGYPAWMRRLFEPQAEKLEHGKDRALEWMSVGEYMKKHAPGEWPELPTPETLRYRGSLDWSHLTAVVKIAWAEGGALEAGRWTSAILRSVEPFLSEAPGMVIFFLNDLAKLHFGGVPLPDGFESLAEQLLESYRFATLEDACHPLAGICVAARNWDGLADILFRRAVTGKFQCECLRNLAWLLPDAFLLRWRGEFARCPGLAQLFVEVWIQRGVTFSGAQLE